MKQQNPPTMFAKQSCLNTALIAITSIILTSCTGGGGGGGGGSSAAANSAPFFSITSDSISIPENSVYAFYTFSAIDDDTGDSISYSLASGVADNDLFNISTIDSIEAASDTSTGTTSGELSFINAPDYENDDYYEVQISASDGSLSAEADLMLTVTITDVNEAPAFTTNADTTNVSENSTETFYTASATDEDISDSISYSLASGVADNDLFNIETASGKLSFKVAPNYEIDNHYEVQISASDGSLSADNNLPLTINVTDVNEKPTFTINPNTTTARENNTEVFYTASATDEDTGDNISYFLVDGVADNDLFNIETVSGDISFKNAPNYETDGPYEVRIIADDGSLKADNDLILTVTITDINEAPIFTTNTEATSASENSIEIFYTALATDEDANSSISYSLASGIADNDFFNIDTASGELSFISPPDYETDNYYEVEISASDGNLSVESNLLLTVTITNVNEALAFVINPDAASAPENSTAVFYTASATDEDINESISYSLASGVADNDLFDIDNTSGDISFKSAPNYETDGPYEVQISASDGNLSADADLVLSVIITDANDAPAFTINTDTASTPENSTEVFYTASATDEDANHSLSYYLASGVEDNDFLSIDAASGELSFKSAPDHETDDSYSVQISASDGNLSSENDLLLTITITDVNEVPPAFTINPDTANAPENSTEVFYTALATDEDSNESVSYSLASAVADNDLFNIDTNSGELSFKSAPNYETDGPYEVQISASDGNFSADADLVLSVIITDANDAPAFTTESDTASTNENNTKVFYIASARDEDISDRVSYSLADGVLDNDSFSLETTTGGLSFKSAPNYEANDLYELQISASDGNLSADTDLMLTVSITDVAEAPAFTTNPDTASAPENSTAVFYTASATDEDANSSVSYSLVSGAADNDLFNIDTSTGELSFKSAREYETDGPYEVQISASDGSFSASKDLALSVTIEFVNEAPVFATNPDAISIPENSSQVFYVASATDINIYDKVSYSLAAGIADNDLFSIDTRTGGLSFKSAPDYEASDYYEIQISASDGNLSADSDLMLSVSVTDVNEAPTAVISINPDPAANIITTATEVTLDCYSSSDPEYGIDLQCTWSQSAEQSQLIGPGYETSSRISFTAEAGTYTFTLTVSDGELQDSTASEITIHPVTIPDDFAGIAGDNQVTLTWTPYSDSTIYNIYRSTNASCDLDNYNNACSDSALFSNVASGFIDTGISNGAIYHYWIEAVLNGITQRATDHISVILKRTMPTQTGVLNDSGIDWGGNFSYINNSDCSSNISATQDCDHGRDVTHNDESDGHAGFSFTKLDSDGNTLDASATEWSCVQDNVTGLIWETKTTDGGLHDKYDRYSWYNTDPTTNGGGVGFEEASDEDDHNICYGYKTSDPASFCNTEAFVNRVNTASLCGASDWRLPSKEELRSIVDYSRYNPSIDTDYFPNTIDYGYWSSTSAVSSGPRSAWGIYFYGGFDYLTNREYVENVRLVRTKPKQ